MQKHPKTLLTVRWGILLLMPIVAAGLLLRLVALNQESAWGDEALTTACLPANGFGAYLDCVFAQDPRLRLAPVYYWVQYTWSLAGSGSLYALRLLSVALYVVSCFQIFSLGRAIGGERAGLWAAALFSLSLFQVYYGQEVRFYALMNVFALAALQGLVVYIRRPGAAPLLLCIAGNAALVWTHTFSVVFVLSQGIFMFSQRRRRGAFLAWFGCHAMMAAGLFVWLALLDYDFAGQSAAYRDMPAGPRELANAMLQFAGGRFSNINPADYIATGISADLPIAVTIALLVSFALARTLRHPEKAEGAAHPGEVLLLLVLFAGPVLLLYTMGWLWRPCFFSRYLIFSALPLHILAGLGLAHLPRGAIGRGIAAVVVLLFAWQHAALPRPFRADYQEVARLVANDPSSDIAVLALKQFNYDAVAYALRGSPAPVTLLHGIRETIEAAREKARAGASVWVVFYRWDDLVAFTSALAAEGAGIQHVQSAGMPPLDLIHVTAPTGAK